jgi:S-adenosylmethionine decarboxylase
MSALGKHLLIEYFDCDTDSLNSPETVERLMSEAAEACGATIVRSVFHAFNPIGVSGVVVISESHLAIHTWPEYGYAAVDVFTCGDTVDPRTAEAFLRDRFGAGSAVVNEISRGILQTPEAKKRLAHKIEVTPRRPVTRPKLVQTAAG